MQPVIVHAGLRCIVQEIVLEHRHRVPGSGLRTDAGPMLPVGAALHVVAVAVRLRCRGPGEQDAPAVRPGMQVQQFNGQRAAAGDLHVVEVEEIAEGVDPDETDLNGLPVVSADVDRVRLPLRAVRGGPCRRVRRGGGQCDTCCVVDRGPTRATVVADVHAEAVVVTRTIGREGPIEAQLAGGKAGQVDARRDETVLLAHAIVVVVVDGPGTGGTAVDPIGQYRGRPGRQAIGVLQTPSSRRRNDGHGKPLAERCRNDGPVRNSDRTGGLVIPNEGITAEQGGHGNGVRACGADHQWRGEGEGGARPCGDRTGEGLGHPGTGVKAVAHREVGLGVRSEIPHGGAHDRAAPCAVDGS